MFLEGVVENGHIKLDADIRLPDGTKVYMVIPDVEIETNVVHLHSPRLTHPEQATDFTMAVIGEKE